jgi:O-antigen ligase
VSEVLGAPGLRSPGRGVAVWCGWVLIVAAVLIPLTGWLAPREFSVLVAGVGLFCLPALRIADEDRPAALILFAALIWAAVSTMWSPYHPSKPGNSTILKLAFELPLYWSAISAGRRADPVLRTRALQILAWGCALYGLALFTEALDGGVLYKAVHAHYDPMRDDIAEAKIGHSTFVLGMLWPLAAYGAGARFRWWLALVMAAGAGASAIAFGSDAPVLGLVLAPLVGVIVLRWSKGAPRVMALAVAAIFLLAPAGIWAIRHFGDYAAIQAAMPTSYALRMGYWSHAVDWIRLHPLRGCGLEASREFGPGIKLHPHNDALQVWMELGAIGAVAAASFWGVALSRLSRTYSNLLAATTAASASVYLLFAMFNFGVWQEWWLALGTMIPMLAAMNTPAAVPKPRS